MPSRELVRKAKKAMKRAADVDFFFNELQSPDWILPLQDEGMFKDPPSPVQQGDYISFPAWAASRYLKRVSASAPGPVRDTILAMPKIDNPRVQEDLVDAALEMPSTTAAGLVPLIIEWTKSPYQILLPDKVAQLSVKLAQSGEGKAALQLVGDLLEILPATSEGLPRPKSVSLVTEPRPKFDPHQYELILTRYIPDLVKAIGEGSLDMLADALENAVSSSKPLGPDGEDYSYVWRPSIEQSSQVHDHDLRGNLVRAVRDAADLVVRSEPARLESVVNRLEKRPWKIFRRIALHLLRLHAQPGNPLVRTRLLDPALAEDHGIFHEFILLARDFFGPLALEDKDAFLSNLGDRFKREETEALAIADTVEKDRELRSARHWIYRRLTFIADALPTDWRKRYDDLRTEFGQLEHPDFLTYSSGVWHGPTTPKAEGELEEMSVEEIISFLREWKPSGQWMDDSAEGLARTVSSVVASSPVRFAEAADRFREVDPTYVHWLFFGLAEALKAKRSFAWERVISLANWVVSQPREIPGRVSEYSDIDPGWVWTRSAIANLLEDGFRSDTDGVPYSQREAAWQIVKVLTDDPDPTSDQERERGTGLDPFGLAINSTRGKAMNAAVQYGLWVRRNTSGQEEGTAESVTFEDIPELRQVLDAHLDPAREQSIAIRSIYGRWFPWLYLLDSGWTRSNVPRIFPRAADQERFRVVAWDGYVLFAGVYNNMLDVLADEYAAAIDRLDTTDSQAVKASDTERRLAEHLMVFALRGKLLIEEQDGLLQRFFRSASPDLRAAAMGAVGTMIHGDEVPPLPDDVREWLERLWEWRVRENEVVPREKRAAEISEFGWWFASGKFPDAWVVPQLVTAYRLAGRVEVAHLAMERLENVAESYPQDAVEALELAIQGDDKGWDYTLWAAHAEGILRKALDSGVASARERAIQLIDLLAAKGNRAYAHLIADA